MGGTSQNTFESITRNLGLARLSNRILREARQRIDKFELELLRILKDEFDLIGATFYSVSPYSDTLGLRGQVGLSYSDYDLFSIGRRSPAGQALASSHAIAFSDLLQRDDYTNKALVQRWALDELIAIPLRFPSHDDETAVSVVCLYPKRTSSSSDILQFNPFFDGLQETIEIALQHSLDFTCHFLRRELIHGTLSGSDTASFLHKTLQVLKQWNFEAGSVFLFDGRAACLRLAATTGIDSSGLPRSSIFYKLTETDHRTVTAFKEQSALLIEKNHLGQGPPKYREKLSHEFNSALVWPLFAPGEEGARRKLAYNGCLGVMRIVNRQIVPDGSVETAAFTWEDKQIIAFLCDLLGVVVNLYQRVDRKDSDLERIVHGLETSILTVIGALHNIDENVEHARVFPLSLMHSIPNTIAFTEAMHEQIKMFKARTPQDFQPGTPTQTKIYGDIISKIPLFAKNSAQFYGVEDIWVDTESFFRSEQIGQGAGRMRSRVLPIPVVRTDTDLLLSVLKNLVENAVKYSRPNSRCAIKVHWAARTDCLEISVTDAGIGVPPEDVAFIFNESYQAENAMRRRTSGTGLGLYQCRMMMEKLRGSIRYQREVDNPDGYVTTFVVRIPMEASEK